MAFGDAREVVQAKFDFADSSSTVTATYATETPAVNDLNIAHHFTGATSSNVDTAGFTEDQLLTNGTENDEGAIYSQLVTGASDDTVTCSSSAADEQMLIFTLIGGAFAESPADLSASSGRSAADPVTTGASGGNTGQADEYMTAILCIRNTADQTAAWNRLGDATPTSDMTEYSGGGISSNAKRVEAAGQVLTAVGTVGIDRANSTNIIEMIGYVTYKRAAAAVAVAYAYWM